MSDTSNDNVDVLDVEAWGDDSNGEKVSALDSGVNSAALSVADLGKKEKEEVRSGPLIGQETPKRQLDADTFAKASMENVRNVTYCL